MLRDSQPTPDLIGEVQACILLPDHGEAEDAPTRGRGFHEGYPFSEYLDGMEYMQLERRTYVGVTNQIRLQARKI